MCTCMYTLGIQILECTFIHIHIYVSVLFIFACRPCPCMQTECAAERQATWVFKQLEGRQLNAATSTTRHYAG